MVSKTMNNSSAMLKTVPSKTEGYIDSFERLPENLQMVLVDMVYNLGKTGFNWKQTTKTLKNGTTKKYGYPNFWKKLAQRDIEGLTAECERKSLTTRNEAMRALIQETPDSWTKKGLKK